MSAEEPRVLHADLAIIDIRLQNMVAGNFAILDEHQQASSSLSQILQVIDQLEAKLATQQATITESELQGNTLMAAMMEMAAGDYTKRIEIGNGDTLFDALAAGLNMLADEFVAAQQEHARLQERIIQTQAAAIRELSTPLIPISNDILVMPLIGTIDTARAQDVLERLLEGVATHQTQTVILDITGVAVVDTQIAKALVQAAQAVQLLGTQLVLTGIRPEVAQTLVNLGVELRGIVTWSTMQMGIAHAIRQSSKRDGAHRNA